MLPRAESGRLAEITPPRGLEASMGAARGLFGAIASMQVSLEAAVDRTGSRWYVRAERDELLAAATAQLRVAYPQAVVETVPADRPDLDPVVALAGECPAVAVLQPATDAALPLRADWRHERDPLAGVLAAADVRAAERLVCRLAIGPVPSASADRIRRRVERADRWRVSGGNTGPSLLPVVAAMGLGAALLQGWRWYEAGAWLPLIAGTAGAFVGVPLLAVVAKRLLGGPEPLPAAVADRKLAGTLAAAGIEIRAFAATPERARALVERVAAAYGAYDDPAGGALRGQVAGRFGPRARGALPLLLNAGELAALWHLPDDEGATAIGVRRTTARRLPPAPGHARQGVRVGASSSPASGGAVYLPAPLLHRNHLIVAKTRRGKSTLMRHLAAGLMERLDAGVDETAIVVVDPHQDLAEAVLASVPESLAERTVYLDFANLDRPVGLNLIDVALFPDRDRTTEHIVTMLNRLWPANWGPRMEGALRAALATLLEVNALHGRDEQYTLLDVAPLLTDERLRRRLLAEVADPALLAWWRDNYDRAGRTLQQQTANPVTSKIGRFTVTEASRLVLGQARSTFDPRAVIRDGGVLVVNTAVGALGEGAASLVGATLLNLLGLLVEEQVALPAARRRRVVGFVDESSTLGAVDYPRMLSELGKYGASFVLVTQSLTKLDAIDRNLAPTIFANSDGLTVFQVSAEDARRLTPELGGAIEVEDLVSLDDFTCYARWWDGRTRPPAFSLVIDPPPPAAAERARAIARRSAARHGRPRDEVVDEVTRTLAERSPAAPPREPRSSSRSRAPVATDGDGTVAPTGNTNTAIDAVTSPARGNAQRGDRQKAREKTKEERQ